MSGRILIAGTGSSSGKTSITCGLLQALCRQGLSVSACKCGPDYIDPQFHREIIGTHSRNLDLFLCGENAVLSLLAESVRNSDITVIEGVMGFYDGMGSTPKGSSHHISELTGTPVLLVADCRGKSLSLAAEIAGFIKFCKNNIAGIVLNRATENSYPMFKQMVEAHCGLPVVGYLPTIPQAELESRKLGLISAPEVENLRKKMALLADSMAKTVDLEKILSISRSATPLRMIKPEFLPVAPVRIAVAKDRAFSFTYPDNLSLIEALGGEIVFFSPIKDKHLPENVDGLLLNGGYPELYAEEISENKALLNDMKQRIIGGLPVIAECGGFVLLCKELKLSDNSIYPMAAVIDTSVRVSEKLSKFGYTTLTAKCDNLLCKAGESIPAHEFHYTEAEYPGDAFWAVKQNGVQWESIYASDTLFAGFSHLHFWGCKDSVKRFILKCAEYKEGLR